MRSKSKITQMSLLSVEQLRLVDKALKEKGFRPTPTSEAMYLHEVMKFHCGELGGERHWVLTTAQQALA